MDDGDKQSKPSVASTPAQVISAEQGMEHRLTTQKKGRQKRRRLIILLVVVLLVVVAGLIGRSIYKSKQSDKKSEKLAFQTMIGQEEVAHNSRKDDVAKKLLTDFMAKYPHIDDKDQRYKIDNAMVAIFSTASDFKNAQIWQLKSLEDSPKLSFKDYYNLAETCQRNGDKECAKKYYKKSLDEINSGAKPPSVDGFRNYINMRLKALES